MHIPACETAELDILSFDAALAASLFHYRELTVGEVKAHLREKNIPVRL